MVYKDLTCGLAWMRWQRQLAWTSPEEWQGCRRYLGFCRGTRRGVSRIRLSGEPEKDEAKRATLIFVIDDSPPHMFVQLSTSPETWPTTSLSDRT